MAENSFVPGQIQPYNKEPWFSRYRIQLLSIIGFLYIASISFTIFINKIPYNWKLNTLIISSAILGFFAFLLKHKSGIDLLSIAFSIFIYQQVKNSFKKDIIKKNPTASIFAWSIVLISRKMFDRILKEGFKFITKTPAKKKNLKKTLTYKRQLSS